MTGRKRRRPALRLVGASALAAVAVGMGGSARADTATAPTLGGYNVTADANGVDLLLDNATGLAGIHPVTEADFPAAQSQFATGPFGSGLAAVFYPGSAGANFGSLAPELGIPAQLDPIVSKLNDPVRASAQYPAGPATSSYPAGSGSGVAEMHATAGPGGTTATSAVLDQTAASIFGFSAVRGTSSALADSTARADATSDLTGLTLAGGLIRIGAVTSTASATSDGTTGSGSATTTIAGVTVLGQPASIGSGGLVLPDFAKTLGPVIGGVVQDALHQVIAGLGITITELPGTETRKGAGFTATSGGLSVEIVPPASAAPLLEKAASVLAPLFPSQLAIVPTLPGLLQGLNVTLTLGRATASADASPSFSDSFNPPPATGTSGTGTGSATVAGATGGAGPGSATVATGTGGSSAIGTATTPIAAAGSDPTLAGTGPAASLSAAGSTGSTGGTGAGGAGPAAASTGPATLIDLSSPLSAGMVALGLVLTGLAAFGLWRVGRLLLPSDADPVCPLGQDAP